MQIKNFCCVNFRNISALEFEPDKQMNVIFGENAHGKTNIIEALWLFTGAKSFRNAKDSAFVKFGCEKGKTRADYEFRGVLNTAEMIFTDTRSAYFNSKKLSSASKLAGNYTAVVFSPSDLSLITDGPNYRRKFLDTAIGQLYPNYIEILKSYSRAIIQRNRIIKEYKYDKTLCVMLDVFEKELASSGKKIINYRKEYIKTLKTFVPEIYSGLSKERENITFKYILSCEKELLSEKLKNSRNEDMYSGVTSVGPHRDELAFFLNGINVRNFGSQGQKRSVALTLKLAQSEVIKQITGEKPICLLDDVMSELDLSRQNYILNHIKDMQSFITCCDPNNTEQLKSGKIFKIKDGKIEE